MKVILEDVEIKITRTGKDTFKFESELPGLSNEVDVYKGDSITVTLPNVLVEAERPIDLKTKGVIKL